MPKPRKHKRNGPKSTRAGCLLCKPHKHQNCRTVRHADLRRAGETTHRGHGQASY